MAFRTPGVLILSMLVLASLCTACSPDRGPTDSQGSGVTPTGPGSPSDTLTPGLNPAPLISPTNTPTDGSGSSPLVSPTGRPTDGPFVSPLDSPLGTPEQTILPTHTPIPPIKQGYGISVKGLKYTDDSLDKAIALRWEWIKIYDHPPAERLPFKVLFRVNLPHPDEDWAQWGHYRFLDAELYAGRIDAYEIGNEPNLIEEWGGYPDPAAYAELLKIAYREIKSADPNALVVSAGLAPVGESGDPRYVDDLVFTRALYEHGAAGHFDVMGVHPYGFAYAPEMPTDGKICPRYTRLDGPVLGEGCRPVKGMCFRRAELLREIMVEYGDGDKPVWATEFGWIIRPPACCLGKADWQGRQWQAVSEPRQAWYIERAFRYTQANWPWMEVMFLWNLDYSRYPSKLEEDCPYCDSMGWYSILHPDGAPRLAYEWLLAAP